MTTETTPVKKKFGRLAKAVTALGVGGAMLIAGGTVSAWQAGFGISQERVASGALDLQVTAEQWIKNGQPINSSDLSAVALVPGDMISYSAQASAVHQGSFTSYLYLKEAEKVADSLTDASQATVAYTLDGEAGAVKTITPELSGTKHDATFSLQVGQHASPGLRLDLSQIKPTASMVKPAEATPAPGAGDFDIFAFGFGLTNGGAGDAVETGAIALAAKDLEAGKKVPMGTKITTVLEYSGSNPRVDFTKPPMGLSWNQSQNSLWSVVKAEKNRLTLVHTSTYEEPDVYAPSFRWLLDATNLPEPGSLKLSASVDGPAGADFPDGTSIPSTVLATK